MHKTITLTLLTLTMLFAVPVAAEEFTLDDEALARLFASEHSGLHHPDYRPISYIVNQRARSRHQSVAAYIASHHYRHTRSHSRPYLAFLNRSEQYPAGWPHDAAHWERAGRPQWHEMLVAAHEANEGRLGHGCSEPPLDWAGRIVDCVNLQARLNGNWHEVECGPTANMMIARGHRDPVPDLRCEEVQREAYIRRMARRAAQQP